MVTRRDLLLASPALLAWSCARRTTPLVPRGVAQVFDAQPTRDGAGVSLLRALGHRGLSVLDPFLLLDSFHTDDPNDYLAGFPDHPHRGFETVTYMVHGAMEHRDSVGNHGRLGPGAAQWMTAGRGLIHSEMPKQERGLMWGFQLWVNLPAARKLIPPRYQDIPASEIPDVAFEGGTARVVAGAALGRTGPVRGIDVQPLFLDVTLQPGARVAQALPSGHTAFCYVTEGAVRVGANRQAVARGQLATTTQGDALDLEGQGSGGRVLLLAARPLHEPIARAGPFVMNTEAELQQAWDDYRSGRLVHPG